MAITGGVHHIATKTADLDRLIAFYRDVLGAPTVHVMREEGLRHAFIDLGGSTVLHPFEIAGAEVVQGEEPMFDRGRIDHFALRADTREDLEALRARIVDAGAGDGEAVDMGEVVSVGFFDPDGQWSEVMWDRPGASGGLEREQWRRRPYPDPILA